jgi:hypothetical protein
VTFISVSDTVAGLDFGQTRRALVTGTVFNDENGDGNSDRGEAVQSGRTVFADANDPAVAVQVERVVDRRTPAASEPARRSAPTRRTSLASDLLAEQTQ